MQRRDFLTAGVYAAGGFAAPTLRALVAGPQKPPDRQHGNGPNVAAADVAFVQEMTRSLGLLDNRHGGGQVRRSTVGFLHDQVGPLLTRGRFLEATGQELIRAAAELTRLVGWMTHDVGGHGLAQRYLIQGLGLAQAANDPALMSEMLAAMSQQATYLGHARDAVDLARSARVLAQREGVTALAAEASVMEAHGHARGGDAAACVSALSVAEKALDQADRSSDPHWIGYFDEAYLSAKFGHCFRELGDHGNAVKFAERSLDMDPRYVRGKVFNLTLLAHAHAQAGDVEHACAVGQEAAATAVNLRSHRAVKHLRDFRSALPSASHSADVARLDHVLAPILSAA